MICICLIVILITATGLQLFSCERSRSEASHRSVDLIAAVLKLLLDPLLEEVDAQLEAEVLLLQIIEVLRESSVSVRHVRRECVCVCV